MNDFWLLFVPLVGGVGLLNLLQAYFMAPAAFNVIAPAALYLMGMAALVVGLIAPGWCRTCRGWH